MSRRTRAQRIASGAAYGGGGFVGLLGGAFGLLLAQTLLARRRVGSPRITPFMADGCYLPADGVADPAARPYRFAMIGDSGAAGLGADEPDDTPAVVVAHGLEADCPPEAVVHPDARRRVPLEAGLLQQAPGARLQRLDTGVLGFDHAPVNVPRYAVLRESRRPVDSTALGRDVTPGTPLR